MFLSALTYINMLCAFVLFALTPYFSTECPLAFIQPLTDTSVAEDEPAMLECRLTRPVRQLNWYKNGEEVVPSEMVQIIAEYDVHKLVISRAHFGDAADYSVVAGDQTSRAKLTIEGRDTDIAMATDVVVVFVAFPCVWTVYYNFNF